MLLTCTYGLLQSHSNFCVLHKVELLEIYVDTYNSVSVVELIFRLFKVEIINTYHDINS